MEPTRPDADTIERQIIISREIAAPADLVFEMYTDHKHLDVWWGPRGFRSTTTEFDFREGGRWIYTMHGGDGTDYPNEIVYRDITRPSRIAYDHGEGGGVFMFQGEIRFDALGSGSTKVTICLTFPTKQQRDDCVEKYGAVEGGEQNLARLDEAIAFRSADTVEITRDINADRDAVWRAWTEKVAYDNWFAPVGFTTESKTFDLRPGGTLHHHMTGPGGAEMWGLWRILDVVPGRRIVYLNSFSNEAGDVMAHPMAAGWPVEMISAVSFEWTESGTGVTIHSRPYNATDETSRVFTDNHDSLRGGWGGTFERLEKFLETGSPG